MKDKIIKLIFQLGLIAGITTLAVFKAEGWGWLLFILFMTF